MGDVFYESLSKLYWLLGIVGIGMFTIYWMVVIHEWKKRHHAIHAAITAEGSPLSFHYVTPEEAKAFGDERSLTELKYLASLHQNCSACGSPAWKYAGSGLCFSCTTGESDASNDYELQE